MTDLSKPSSLQRTLHTVGGALRPWLILLVVVAGFSLHPGFRQTFWTASYLPSILQQAATNIILAVGLTFVILTGGIDLSVGSVMALCGVALGLTYTGGLPPFLRYTIGMPLGALLAMPVGLYLHKRAASRMAIWTGVLVAVLVGAGAGGMFLGRLSHGATLETALLAALAVGVTCGLLNGVVVSVGRVPSFVVTLGMFRAARDLAVYATDGKSVSGLPRELGALGQGAPVVIIFLTAVVIGVILHTLTRSGRMIQAVGANEEATRLSGVNVTAYKILAYLLSGVGAALAAIVLTAKFQLADTGAGVGAELNAIAAVVIGGTSLSGGRGTVLGSLVGALTIAVLNAGLVLVGVKDTLQGVVIGAVIVLAVLLDRRESR